MLGARPCAGKDTLFFFFLFFLFRKIKLLFCTNIQVRVDAWHSQRQTLASKHTVVIGQLKQEGERRIKFLDIVKTGGPLLPITRILGLFPPEPKYNQSPRL